MGKYLAVICLLFLVITTAKAQDEEEEQETQEQDEYILSHPRNNHRDRGDRGYYGNEGGGNHGNDERGYYGNDDRGYYGNDDRGYHGNDDRGYYGNDDRSYYGNDDRGYYGNDDRGYHGNDDRGYYGNDDRGYNGNDDRGYNGNEERSRRGNTNTGNSGNYDCLSNYRTRLRTTFTDGYMNRVCDSRNNWNHNRLRKDRPKPANFNFDKIEQDLYKNMDKPYPSSLHGYKLKARKEYRMLSDDERRRFHNAINTLKRHQVGKTNYYDMLSDYHQSHVAPTAHWGPGFLGWHKQYLLRMEKALQAIDPSVTIPYWDSTLDSHLLGQESHSIMWSKDFMGNREGPVRTGPFAHWRIPRPVGGRYYLWRGNGTEGRLISDADYHYIMNIKDFRGLTWHVDPYYELIHGSPHFWVGGTMGDIEASPFDPIFFLHHSFIDLMWDAQREKVYRNYGRSRYYYPSVYDNQAFGVGEILDPISNVPIILRYASESPHYPPKYLSPFDILTRDSLTEEYKKIYYYEGRPSCSYAKPYCGSPYLFCIKGTYKCAPKLMIGANCESFATSDCCHKGECIHGRCQPKSTRNNDDGFFHYWNVNRRYY